MLINFLAICNKKNSILLQGYYQGSVVQEKAFHLLTEEYAIVLVTSLEHLQAVKDIRAEVFVPRLEMSFEELEARDFLINRDDEQSFIYLLQHKATKAYVGSIRVIFVNEKTPIQVIPMQRDGKVEGIDDLTQKRPICEISRLSLIKSLPEHQDFSMSQLRTLLSMSLMSATRINFFLYHYANIFAIMEHSLHRILKRQSVAFKPIGDAVDYYGVRFPFAINQRDLALAIEKTEESMGKVTKYYLRELCKNSKSFWDFIDNNPYIERSDIHLDKICQIFKEYGENISIERLVRETFNEHGVKA